MRSSPILFTLLILVLAVPAVSQEILSKKLNIPSGQYLVEDLLQKIRDEGINVAYTSNLLPREPVQLTTGEVKNLTVLGLLKKLKSKTSIDFKYASGMVMVTMTTKKYTVSGSVRDATSGEILIGATVFVRDTEAGSITNDYGFYSLTLPEGSYEVVFRYVGFEQVIQKVELKENIQLVIRMKEIPEELDEVMVFSNQTNYNITNMVPGLTSISFGEKWPIPYFLGEQDVFQNALAMPGIRSIGEDATGLNVRGGDVDQNLILLDEAPIYNPNHFYGLISVFNPEAVNNVEIMRGHIPPQYGGRASSVINIIQREGNNQHFEASGGLGLVSGRLAIEGPIKKGQSSYLISGRRSLINFSVEDFVNEALDDSRTNFFDFNAKLNFNLNRGNRILISTYYGRDRNRAGFDAIRKWGNRSLSVRWNKIFNPKLFSNFTAVISEYNYQIQDPQEVGSFIGKSLIRNYAFKADFGYNINPSNTVNFGLHNTFHKLKPGEREPFDENASTNPVFLDNEDALETAFYMSHQASVGQRWNFDYGLRWSLLQNFGPGDIYAYRPNQPFSDQSIVDTLSVRSGQVFNRRLGWEPRLSVNFIIDDRQSIKASYGKTYQFIHLISNTIAPSPTDIWKLSDRAINPTISDHYSIGYYRNSKNNGWESNIEFYYKDLDNVIDFKDGADLLFNENIETELLSGTGRAFGVELFLKKNMGKLRGWISYTLSKSEHRFKNKQEELTINKGAFFPTNFDKRHDINLTSIYSISPRLSISGSFNYNSGRPLTLPLGKYVYDGKIVPHFEDRNLYRLPDYHRLDLSLRLDGRKTTRSGRTRKLTDNWVLTLYNVYGRRNIYSYFFRESEKTPGQTEAIPYSIFGSIIPSITYNFRF